MRIRGISVINFNYLNIPGSDVIGDELVSQSVSERETGLTRLWKFRLDKQYNN